MSKYRQAARIDSNQQAIVKALRQIPGVTVQTGMDDLLVGYLKKNYWFELKNPDKISTVTGKVNKSRIQPSQHDLLANWRGHYAIVWSLGQILAEIGA